MAQCPVCNAQVLEDFGSTECVSCGAQLLIHVDGTVEAMGHTAESAEPAAHSHEPAPGAEASSPAHDVPPAEENSPYHQDLFGKEPSHQADEPTQMTDPHAPKPDIFADPEAEANAHGDADANAYAEGDASAPASAVEEAPPVDIFADEPYVPPPMTSNSSDLSDIADFGNSEASSGRDGALRYTLRIHGIDTSDVREAFREALTDRKFLWDTDQILRSIRNGEVQIPNIAASKAYMLITRLRSLPVRVQWEQYAVHQS